MPDDGAKGGDDTGSNGAVVCRGVQVRDGGTGSVHGGDCGEGEGDESML